MKSIFLTATLTAIILLPLFLIIGHATPRDLDERAEEALEYCKENGYSTDYCLLVDNASVPTVMAKRVQQGSLCSAMSQGVSAHHWDITWLERKRQ